MTRQEYLAELARELGGFDEAARRDILLEIEDHLDELSRLHPELDEEAIVAGLEAPKALAASLAEELGGAAGGPKAPEAGEAPRAPGGREATGPEGFGGPGEEKRRRGARITIDGQDVEDIIRRALDVAKLFKGRHFYSEDFERAEDDEGPAKRIFVKDIPLFGSRKLSVKTISADLRILLSPGGLSVAAEGGQASKISVTTGDEGTMYVSTPQGAGEPDRIELRVPANLDLLSIGTASGDVEVLDRVGDLEVRTASGDVEVKACSGSVVVTTASGDVELEGCSERLRVQTASGSISLAIDGSCDQVELVSASGDLELSYPEDFDATFRWKTLSGEVDCDLAAAGARGAVLGAGLVPVFLSTTSGDIGIRRA